MLAGYGSPSMNQRRQRRQRRRLPSEPVDLEITSLSHEGRGIAHIDGKVAFVDGALESERVSAVYVRKRGQFDELRTVSVHTPSIDRVVPPCSFAERCGGCSLQHMNSDTQIEFKQAVLLDQLKRTANIDADKIELLPKLTADYFHYRRKARLAVRMVAKKGGALVGFREKYSSFITDMDDCKVLHAEVAILIKPLRILITQLQGSHVIPQIEVAVGETREGGRSENRVALVIRHLEKLSAVDVQALTDFAAAQRIDLYLQPSGIESVSKLYPNDGVERLQYFLPDYELTLCFHPMDFTQINAGINRQIINQALNLLELNKADVVLDLFCGLGNFTLPLATLCDRVTGVEGSEALVSRGEENAKLNNLSNATFFAANLCESIVDKEWFTDDTTKILLDPPRSGAIEIIVQIAQLKAEKIVYISCNPATLARDAAALIGAGYKLKSAGVMDMFPHTTHVESMAVFELAS